MLDEMLVLFGREGGCVCVRRLASPRHLHLDHRADEAVELGATGGIMRRAATGAGAATAGGGSGHDCCNASCRLLEKNSETIFVSVPPTRQDLFASCAHVNKRTSSTEIGGHSKNT